MTDMLAPSLPSMQLLVGWQLTCSMSTTATFLQAKRGDLSALNMLLTARCNFAALASEPVMKLQHG